MWNMPTEWKGYSEYLFQFFFAAEHFSTSVSSKMYCFLVYGNPPPLRPPSAVLQLVMIVQ